MEKIKNEFFLSPWIEKLPFTWKPLIEVGQRIQIKKHEYLFHQDHPAEYAYLVVEGRIRLFLTSPSGEENTIAIMGENGLIGECGVLGFSSYNVSAITESNAIIVRIPKSIFETVVQANYSIAKQIMIIMNIKNRILASHTMALSHYSAVQRICYTLIQLVSTYGIKLENGELITIRFTHQELANLVGTSRVTVTNTMKQLEKEGILQKIEGKYLITNKENMELFSTNSK